MMDELTIKIEVKNYSFAWIFAEDSVKAELSDHLCFEVPGYKFMPKYKAGIWDGKIRLFNRFANTIHVGLLPNLKKFADAAGYKIDYGHGIKSYFFNENYSEQGLDDWLGSLQITDETGEPIVLNDHQVEAIHSCIKNNRILTLSPTSSGKSLIIYCLARWYLEVEKIQGKVLIVVPLTTLVTQMSEDFRSYALTDSCSPELSDIHQIMSGKEKASSNSVFVSTWQSIYKMAPKWFDQFDVIIVDEAHLAKGASLQTVLENSTSTRFRHGFTGTLDGTNVNKLVIQGGIGPVRQFVTTAELMEKGIVAQLKITNLILRYSQDESKLLKLKDYNAEVDHLITSKKRNETIRKLVESLKGNVLILFTKKDHGRELEKILSGINDRQVFLRHGDHSVEERNDAKKTMEADHDVVAVVSYGTFSTGISIRNIRHVILAAPTKSRIRTLQTIGRGLRIRHDKDTVQLWDIVDDFSILGKGGQVTRKNFSLKHFEERAKFYDQEKFDYRTSVLNME